MNWELKQRRTSTGSEPFSLLIILDATPSVLVLLETIRPKICSKSRPEGAKSPLTVDVRRSKRSLLKLPINVKDREVGVYSLVKLNQSMNVFLIFIRLNIL